MTGYIPYTTIAYIALNVLAFGIQFLFSLPPQKIALHFETIISTNENEWYRYITSQLTHVDLIHIGMNMLSLYSLHFAEIVLGHLNYFLLITFFVIYCPFMTMLLICALDKTRISRQARFHYMLGFSAVLFALSSFSVVLMNGASYRIMGTTIPGWALPFVSLIITQIMVPSASIVGHGAGLIAGFGFIPIYKFVLPEQTASAYANTTRRLYDAELTHPLSLVVCSLIVIVLHIGLYNLLKYVYNYPIVNPFESCLKNRDGDNGEDLDQHHVGRSNERRDNTNTGYYFNTYKKDGIGAAAPPRTTPYIGTHTRSSTAAPSAPTYLDNLDQFNIDADGNLYYTFKKDKMPNSMLFFPPPREPSTSRDNPPVQDTASTTTTTNNASRNNPQYYQPQAEQPTATTNTTSTTAQSPDQYQIQQSNPYEATQGRDDQKYLDGDISNHGYKKPVQVLPKNNNATTIDIEMQRPDQAQNNTDGNIPPVDMIEQRKQMFEQLRKLKREQSQKEIRSNYLFNGYSNPFSTTVE